jgi:nucleoside-diphosphate-sugar epimerase
MNAGESIIGPDDPILVTGAAGFIGLRVIETLLDYGFRNIRCFLRPSGNIAKLEALIQRRNASALIHLVRGNLLSRKDCQEAVSNASVVYHLAAGRGEKLFADAFMNSVVTTRNLMEGCANRGSLKRLVSISSFSVYSNQDKPRGRLLDETCPLEKRPEMRGDAYSFAKVKQDEIVMELGEKLRIPYVIVRPGFVYGPGNEAITGRVGLGTFGIFLHLGGSNQIPLSYVDNCAEAIVLAGIRPGIDGEVFNVVDDDLPSSRRFLRLYKKKAKRIRSVYLPHAVSWLLCFIWEKYSAWSEGQLPAVYNRKVWHAYWKKTRYSNEKLKQRLGWQPRVKAEDALNRYFRACKEKAQHA